MRAEFKLPDLGEGIETGVVSRVLVSLGDRIGVDQPVIEIETDKAALEVPSSVAGRVEEVLVSEGQEIRVGQVLIVVETEARAEGGKGREPSGLGVEASERKLVEQEEEQGQTIEEPTEVEAPSKGEASVSPASKVAAAPSVRKFAREIGVNIAEVKGSGPHGRISMDDVKVHARRMMGQRRVPEMPVQGPSLPDFSRWGKVERRPASQVRKRTAERLALSWDSVPHVTHFDRADVTELEKLRSEHKDKAEALGGKLTITAMLVKIVAGGLKVFPRFNAALDVERGEIVYRKYYHIGVAVDTDRGLLVPVVRDVECKNFIDVSVELTGLSERARSKSIKPEEMQGGCFTVSNLGGIGGSGFTPIVNFPEAAVLGVGRARMEPVYVEGELRPRLMLPLALSYDHRIIDGADAARFMRWIVEAIENPFMVVLEG